MLLKFEFQATKEAKTYAIHALDNHCASKNQLRLYFKKPKIVTKKHFNSITNPSPIKNTTEVV